MDDNILKKAKTEIENEYESIFGKKQKGIVMAILPEQKKILVDVNGNGQETIYNPEKHGDLKIGDEIEI